LPGSPVEAARGISKLEWSPGELYARVWFIVANMSRPTESARAVYNKRNRLQSRQFSTNTDNARADHRLNADNPEREVHQDRLEGRQPRPLCRLPDGRGRHFQNSVLRCHWPRSCGRLRRSRRREALDRFASDQKSRERCFRMTTSPAFPALGAPMSPAWAHGRPQVADLALPKSLISGTFTLAKAVIWWMSLQNPA